MNYHQYHEDVNPSQPWYMPEFESNVFLRLFFLPRVLSES